VFGYISVVVVKGDCVRDSRGLGLCKVGIVGWSVDDECVRGMCSLVTILGRIGREGEGRERQWVRRGRISCWEREQWIFSQKKEGE
jgi:hypothetical protein